MNSRLATRTLHHGLAVCLLASLMTPACVFAQSSDDPVRLQQSAVARLDQWLNTVLKTGDASSAQTELVLVKHDLQTSYSDFRARQDSANAAWNAIKLGDIERYLNRWNSAIADYQLAIKLAETAKRTDYETKALANMSFAETQAGSIDSAADHAAEAVRVGLHCGNVAFYFDALDRAGEAEDKRGNRFAANDYFERALLVSDEIKESRRIYQLYWDRANTYSEDARTCDYKRGYKVCYELMDLANADYRKALNLTQTRGDSYFASMIEDSLHQLDAVRGAAQQAELGNRNLAAASMFQPKLAKDVLVTEAFTAGPLDPGSMAFVESAVASLNQWMVDTQKKGLFVQDLNPTDLYIQGLLAEAKGDETAALPKYLQAVQLLAQDRMTLRDEQARSTFLEDKMSLYYSPALILLEQKRRSEAFDLFEQSRSRVLADLLASRPLDLGSPEDRALFSDLQSQRAKIALQQKRLFNMAGASTRDQNAKLISDLETQIASEQQQYRSLEMRISQRSQRLNGLISSKPLSLDLVQREAAEGGYDVLYYVVLDTNVVVWHISGSGVEVKKVFLPHAVLSIKVGTLHDSLVAPRDSPEAPFDEDISRQLYLYLVQPFADHIQSKHLVIIAQEELTAIPFQALQNPADGKYLGERFSISYAPSATVLSTLPSRSNLKDGDLLAIADPDIHDAGTEVKAIGAMYAGRARVMSEEAVKKADVSSWVGKYNLVHLSVHGKFNSSDPLLSYLQFKSTATEDGHLTAAEMFGLPLMKNSVVVLSACETGRTQATRSGELLGMERSLMYAGASSLVLSSWEVNAASTKLWMETFYHEGQTKTPAEAARLALIAVKAQPAFSHPFYWSTFLLVGK